jgi:peptidoglycan/LPS O-acetylase OafA/YrhL
MLADRIAMTGGRATGFDYLRLGLAVSVVWWHTAVTCYGGVGQDKIYNGQYRPIVALILPMFFSLSGFLVAGSLVRNPEVAKFLGLRALRILPALAVETLISAFLIGPLLTTFGLHEYFVNPEFRSYLLNIIGDIHYHLPGLFLSNPASGIVNGQLWTVPFELRCYFLLAILALVGVANRPKMLFWCSILLQCFLLFRKLEVLNWHWQFNHGPLPGNSLVMMFLAAVLIFTFRSRVPYSLALFAICAALTALCLIVPMGDYFIAYPIAYVTIYIGLQNPKANFIHRLGDLSYGIFLYGFPVQQVVASWGSWTHVWYVNLVCALPITILISWLSWTLIERPALSLRTHLRYLAPIDALIEEIKGRSSGAHARLVRAYGSARR